MGSRSRTVKRILFINDCSKSGGAQKAVNNFADILSELDWIDVYLYRYCEKKNIQKADLGSKNINYIYSERKRILRNFFPLRRWILDNDVDVIFTSLMHVSVVTWLISTTIRKKPILFFRESNSIIKRDNFKFKLLKFFAKKAYKKASIIIASSDEMREEIIEIFKIAPELVAVIPNPVKDRCIKPILESDILDIKESDSINIGYFGRIREHKRIFETVKYLNQSSRGINFNIYGSLDPLSQKVMKSIEECSTRSALHVTFHGWLEDPALCMQKQDIVILLSDYEGMPNSALESLSVGTNVLMLEDCFAYRELRDSSGAFFLSDREDITHFIDNIDLRSIRENKGINKLPEKFRYDSVKVYIDKKFRSLLL